MYNYTISDRNGKEWKRIDKRAARNLYNKGITICMISDNLKPFSMWACEILIDKKTDELSGIETNFNKRVNYFEVYNCINKETGYHAAFYREVENV